ncbi:hypothetical protein [Deinococcus sonorensis]|uniref:Uncharacterized protein n=2 Tax=Deinococcus sonorensis TaxID=309891 RepID=A0AAU7U6E1_9DEIO
MKLTVTAETLKTLLNTSARSPESKIARKKTLAEARQMKGTAKAGQAEQLIAAIRAEGEL